MLNNLLVSLWPPGGLAAAMPFLLQDALFWLLVVFDFLAWYSLVFGGLYLLCRSLAALIPFRRRPVPKAYFIPCLFVSAVFVAWPESRLSAAAAGPLAATLIANGLEHLPRIAACVWLAGAAAQLFLLFRKYLGLRRTCAALPDLPHDPVFDAACALAGTRRQIAVKCGLPGFPIASWCIGRAFVLVPDDFLLAYDERERLCIYVHELTHIRRRDSWKSLSAALIKSVVWFNPLVHSALSLFRTHVEIVCDRACLRATAADPLDYAELIARTASRQKGMVNCFSSEYRRTRRRLGHIVGDAELLASRRGARALACGCVAAFAILLAWCAGGSGTGAMEMFSPPESFTVRGADGGNISIPIRWRHVYSGIFGDYSVVTADASAVEIPPGAELVMEEP